MSARLPALVALLAGFSAARADDKLKAQAAANMKKADADEARVVETEHLVVAAILAEPAAKKLADGLEKVYAQAAKALKLDAADLKGQFTVYAFTNADHFQQFQRSVLKQRPDEGYAAYDVRRDDPFLAVAARRNEKSPNFETLAGPELCRALLAKKAGNAKLPEWMKDGFAKAVVWRMNPSAASADRSAVSRLAPALRKGTKGALTVVDKAWSGSGRDKELVAASLMDFFTTGPGADKFASVIASLIPTTATDAPTFMDALKAADWMVEDLDRAWREWVAKGSPAATGK